MSPLDPAELTWANLFKEKSISLHLLTEPIHTRRRTLLLIRQFARDDSSGREMLRQIQADNISTFGKTVHRI
jgi:hypothetical protein